MFLWTVSIYSSYRSLFLPLGSPISPVAPPTKNIGRSPAMFSLASMMIDTRFPKCNEEEVGSYPQYAALPLFLVKKSEL